MPPKANAKSTHAKSNNTKNLLPCEVTAKANADSPPHTNSRCPRAASPPCDSRGEAPSGAPGPRLFFIFRRCQGEPRVAKSHAYRSSNGFSFFSRKWRNSVGKSHAGGEPGWWRPCRALVDFGSCSWACARVARFSPGFHWQACSPGRGGRGESRAPCSLLSRRAEPEELLPRPRGG